MSHGQNVWTTTLVLQDIARLFSEMCTYYICIYIYKYAYICAYIYIYIVLFGWLNTTHSCADGIPWPPVSKRDADILAFRHHSSSTLGVLMIFFTAAIQIKEYIKTYVILIYIYIFIPWSPKKAFHAKACFVLSNSSRSPVPRPKRDSVCEIIVGCSLWPGRMARIQFTVVATLW